MNGNLQKRVHALIGGFFRFPELKTRITTHIENSVKLTLGSWQDMQLVQVQEETKKMVEERKLGMEKTDEKGGNIIEMMIPGEETVPMAMTLAVKFLTDCPVSRHQLMDENMEIKKKKEDSGEDYSWTDYLSLPFTQNASLKFK
ncbi:hypothetical protein F3Y22_tig00117012pilonHSYRG00182 [Hibiscus syriacus]|uniref:Uncharacterized protein n=1 Tax=Hibiscus syriacus TaxID=106335 RepID=A0A6A2WDI5_HIBSY|nr:hypothetical protein F3Y22_tig00117012pilonHSYRG00182 [Hibiscus syriacus]